MNIALNEALNFTIRAYDILSIYLLSFFLGGQLMFFLKLLQLHARWHLPLVQLCPLLKEHG